MSCPRNSHTPVGCTDHNRMPLGRPAPGLRAPGAQNHPPPPPSPGTNPGHKTRVKQNYIGAPQADFGGPSAPPRPCRVCRVVSVWPPCVGCCILFGPGLVWLQFFVPFVWPKSLGKPSMAETPLPGNLVERPRRKLATLTNGPIQAGHEQRVSVCSSRRA